jgi:hypothetical protein
MEAAQSNRKPECMSLELAASIRNCSNKGAALSLSIQIRQNRTRATKLGKDKDDNGFDAGIEET